eukprot:Opistho-2@85039
MGRSTRVAPAPPVPPQTHEQHHESRGVSSGKDSGVNIKSTVDAVDAEPAIILADVDAPHDVSVDLGAAGPRVNPWENLTPRWTLYEILKTVFGVAVLVPVRLVLIFLLVAMWALCARVSILGVPRKLLQEQPLSQKRRRMILSLRIFPRLIFATIGFSLHEERVDDDGTVLARGAESFPAADDVPPFIVGNHPSIFEPLYLFFRCMPSVVAKAETLNYPMLWSVLGGCQALFVDRADKGSRKKVLDALAKRGHTGQFPPTLIFPEGTTCNGTCLVQFKPGAFVAGAPVLPIIFRFQFHRYDPSWTTQSLPGLLVRTLCQFRTMMRVQVMGAHVPTEAEKTDAALFASNVRDRMARVMGVPVTRHSYEDVFLINEARRAHVKQDFAVADFKIMFGIDESAVKTLVRRFRIIDENGDGRIGFYELRKLLDIDSHNARALQHLETLFEILDADERGDIDFYSFVTALSLSGVVEAVAGVHSPQTLDQSHGDVPMSRGFALEAMAALAEKRRRTLKEADFAPHSTVGTVDPLALPIDKLRMWADD